MRASRPEDEGESAPFDPGLRRERTRVAARRVARPAPGIVVDIALVVPKDRNAY